MSCNFLLKSANNEIQKCGNNEVIEIIALFFYSKQLYDGSKTLVKLLH